MLMIPFCQFFLRGVEPTQHQTFCMSLTSFQSIYLSWSQQKAFKKLSANLYQKIFATTLGIFNAGITRFRGLYTHAFLVLLLPKISGHHLLESSKVHWMTSSIPPSHEVSIIVHKILANGVCVCKFMVRKNLVI